MLTDRPEYEPVCPEGTVVLVPIHMALAGDGWQASGDLWIEAWSSAAEEMLPVPGSLSAEFSDAANVVPTADGYDLFLAGTATEGDLWIEADPQTADAVARAHWVATGSR